jgi:glycosyltransferase involved in cell wall biosynthesis
VGRSQSDEDMTLAEAIEAKSNRYAHLNGEFRRVHQSSLWEPLARDAAIADALPRVSIAIPCFNSSATIPLLIESLAAQQFPMERLEIIFTDDGSSDDTWDVLRSEVSRLQCAVHILRHECNKGRAAARNTGASQARHEILMFLDADMAISDRLLFNHAAKHTLANNLLFCSLTKVVPLSDALVEPLRRNAFQYVLSPDEDWRHRAVIQSDGDARVISNLADTDYFQSFGHGRKYYSKTLAEMVISACLSLSKSLFVEVGGFCERFVGWGREDVFLGAKAISHGALIVPDMNVLYQIDSTGKDAESESRKHRELIANRQLYDQLLRESVADVTLDDQLRLLGPRQTRETVHVSPASRRLPCL